MKNEADKITRELFKELGTESPSGDFRKNIMEKVQAFEKSKPKVYEPIFSKKTLIWIFTLTLSTILALLFFGSEPMHLSFPFELSFSLSFPKINIPEVSLAFPDYNVPNVWVYSLLILPLFFVFERLAQKWLQVKGK